MGRARRRLYLSAARRRRGPRYRRPSPGYRRVLTRRDQRLPRCATARCDRDHLQAGVGATSARAFGTTAVREPEARGFVEAAFELRRPNAPRRPGRARRRDRARDDRPSDAALRRPRARARGRAPRLGDAQAAGDARVHVGARRSSRRACCSSTASSIASRPDSMPAADRRGRRRGAATTSACTSTRNGRAPSSTAATAEPGTPGRRSTRKRADASGTSTRPRSVISNSPSSSVLPNRCFSACSSAQRVAAVAVEREHGVDDVLEHARPGERALLGDVADEHRGAAALLGLLHEPVRAVAHLRDRPGRAGQVGIERRSGSSRAPAPAARPRRRGRARAAATSPARRAGRGASAPTRSARMRTCAHDSSAVTSRQRGAGRGHPPERLQEQRALAHAGLAGEEGDRARHQPALEHAVELADPGGHRARRCWRRRRRSAPGRRPRPGPVDAAPTTRAAASPSVPHASHAGHRPSHRGDSHPHSEHRCTGLRLHARRPYAGGVTLKRTPPPRASGSRPPHSTDTAGCW